MSKQARDRKRSPGQQQQGGGSRSRHQQQAGQSEEFQYIQGENREQDYDREIVEKHRLERDSDR